MYLVSRLTRITIQQVNQLICTHVKPITWLNQSLIKNRSLSDPLLRGSIAISIQKVNIMKAIKFQKGRGGVSVSLRMLPWQQINVDQN